MLINYLSHILALVAVLALRASARLRFVQLALSPQLRVNEGVVDVSQPDSQTNPFISGSEERYI
jgi:S1-C subfamily serine protease